MNTPHSPVRRRVVPLAAKFLALTAAAATFAVASAQAASQSFLFEYSGATLGNSATATGMITIEDTRLTYPVSRNEPISPAALVTAVEMDVSGASAGNGHFTAADFSTYILSIPNPLDLTKEWVGQPQGPAAWGPGRGAGDMNFLRAGGKMSPNGVSAFSLQTFGGETMVLVSVIGSVPSDALVGDAVDGLPGVRVAAVRPGAVDNFGFIYYRGKLAGPGVASTSAECLLKAASPSSILLAREGDALAGGTIKTFGDPVVHAGKLCVKTQLLSGAGGVTTATDDVLAYGNTGDGSLVPIAREGAAVSQPIGFHYFHFDWFHMTDTGVFFGATLADASAKPVKRASVWYFNGASVLPIAVVGGNVTINGTTKTIKTISKPTVSAPAQAQTRVGTDKVITLLIKTTDGATVLKRFSPPTS